MVMARDPSYNTKNYPEVTGDRHVIGGSLDIVTGGDLDIESGGLLKIAGTTVTATATELNTLHGGGFNLGLFDKMVTVEDLAAGADIAGRVIYVVPTGYAVTLSSVSIVPSGSKTGIDAGNTCVVALANGANAIVSKTYNNTTVFPADATEDDLGALSGTYKVLAAGALLKF